jgi:hypothetical protein
MAELDQDNRRFFFGPDGDTKYYIESHSAEDIRGADWQYSKMYTQCLVNDITTSAEMIDILTRRGIIGPDFERRSVELSEQLSEKLALLEQAEDYTTKQELAIEVARAREELFQWNQRLNGPMNNTAEQISDDARLEYLTSTMVVRENGEKVWNSYDIYLKEKSQSLALKARFEIMLYLQGLDSDFLDQTPEAQAMREVQQDILAQAEAAIMAAEAVAKEEEDVEEESKTTPKKKTTRKPSTKKDE